MTYREFLNEMPLETAITNPTSIFQKNVTLYHGTPTRIQNDIIDPALGKTINSGTRLSRPRYSSWWVKDPFFAYFYSITSVIIILAQKIGLIKPNEKINMNNINLLNRLSLADLNNRIIYVNNKYKDLFIKSINEKCAYVYEVTVPWKIVGRGHDRELEEYTLDVPVKAKPIKVDYKKVSQYVTIKFIPEEELIMRGQTIKNGLIEKVPLINKLIYKKKENSREIRKKYRDLIRDKFK